MTATVYRSAVAPPPEPERGTWVGESPQDTAWARLLLSAASILFLLVGLIGLIAGLGPLRAVGLGGYMLFGVGAAPLALIRSVGLSLRLTVAGAGSLIVLVLLSIMMLSGNAWHPSLTATMIFMITAPAHVVGLFWAVKEIPPLSSIRWPGHSWSMTFALSGALLCLIAALTHRHMTPGIGGFLTQIGPIWYVGLAMLLSSLALARSGDERALAIGVLLIMLTLTGTAALVYDGPRSQSAAKHVDFVQQIRQNHYMDSAVTVYNSWPGYFTAMAWLSDVAGIKDPIGLATAWPMLIGLTRLPAMRFLAGQVLKGKLLPWVAVALGVLADPIGADYFSPQSVGFVLGLAIFGVALSSLPVWPKIVGLVLAGSAVTVTHQLSPYIIGGTLCILAVFKMIRPWWMPATLLGPAIVWALVHWSDLKGFLSFGEIGSASNFAPPSTEVTSGLERLPIVRDSSLSLVAGIGLIGVLALIVLFRRRREPAAWGLALAPAAGAGIVAANPYGNEGIFRAMLFAIPWLSLLAAEIFGKLGTKKIALGLLGTLLALSVTFNVAAFGLDASNVLRSGDRAAIQFFNKQNEDQPSLTNFLLIAGAGDLPTGPPTKDWSHQFLNRGDIDPQGSALNEPAELTMTRVTGQFVKYAQDNADGSCRLYMVWSPVTSVYGIEYGIHTAAQFAALRDAFAASSTWKSVFEKNGTVVFEYTPSVAGTGS